MYFGVQFGPAFDKAVIVNGHVAGQINIGRFHSYNFCYDQAYAALCAGAVVLDQFVCHISFIRQVGGDGRHKNAVFDLGIANLKRFE